MKRKFLLTISMLIVFCCFFAISISAAATNEFGTPETINGIDLTGMNEDTVARVVIVDANGEYHTYPAQYVVSSNTKFYYNFKPINTALGTNYNKHSIVRIEVPSNIQIATNCGDLSQTNNMVEIKFFPNSELHTLEYGCFYANKKLQKLNIPRNVTTIGTLIINNSSALKELTFDDGFCAVLPKDSFTGAKGLQRVVFSNQMTTIDRKAFFNSFTSVKEIYLGESLIDLGDAAKVDGGGSDGGNFSYTDGPLKIYASENLFANIDTIERGRLNGWTGNRLLKGVLFYTGTKEQAQALIDKAEGDTPIFTNATLVEWDSSRSDDEYMPSNNSWNIVYSYNICCAFYEGKHDMNGKDVANVTSYFEQIIVGDTCNRCKEGVISETIDPLFVCKGYTVSTFGETFSMAQGFVINNEAIEKYMKYVPDFEYGLIVAGNTADNEAFAPALNGDLCIPQNKLTHDYFDIKITGITSDYADSKIVFCAYVKAGEKVYYLDNYKTCESLTGISYNEIPKA